MTVRRSEALTPRMIRVVLGGSELSDFALLEPAASVRLLLPTRDELEMPTWRGNEFLLPNGHRPVIRTLTPRHLDDATSELVIEIVLHAGGAASRWATAAKPGNPAALSGPGRGYHLDPAAQHFVLVGDETALPAIAQLLEWMPGTLPADVAVQVHIEIAQADAVLPLRISDSIAVAWHLQSADAPPGEALVAAVRSATIPDGARIWAAGEAAAMQQIRRHLFDERRVPRSAATVRGYWKHGRSGDPDSDDE